MHNTDSRPITISLPQGFTIGGVTTWAIATARRLADEGRVIRLVAHPPLSGHDTFDPASALDGANVKLIDAPPLTTPDGFIASVGIYGRLLPSLLLPNLCPESYAVAATLAQTRSDDVRVVSWVHGDNPVDYAYLEHYASIVHRYVAVSRRCQVEMQTRLPHRAKDVCHIPYGIEIPDARQRSTPDGRPLRIVYAGRMEQGIKRVVDLLAIARLLSDAGVLFEMRLIGDGPHADLVDARVAAIAPRLAERGCRLTRESACPPHAMRAVWQWADVSLLASRLEGFSVAMLEAMGAGCVPVVSRVASGVSDIIRDDANGLSFEIGDIESAAACLTRLATDPERVMTLSAGARASAVAEVGMERYLDRIRPLLSDASAAAPLRWPPSHPVSMPSVIDLAGAVPRYDASESYESVIDFLMSRPDTTRVAIYGLGVNGLTLVERLRADAYLGNRQIVGIDDHAHPEIFKTMELPRFSLSDVSKWPRNAVAIVTPNAPAPMIARLQSVHAEHGVDFVCLNHADRMESASGGAEAESMAC